MNTPMPELPHAVYTAFNETTKLYTADQMQAYARAAIEDVTYTLRSINIERNQQQKAKS